MVMLPHVNYSAISTHILTKRMTDINTLLEIAVFISTHILTKRMTASILYGCISTYISTHILTKRMTIVNAYKYLSRYISTHILTKRMTKMNALPFGDNIHFNSHPHEEDDYTSTASISIIIIYFNSHPHEEDDRFSLHHFFCSFISTHILTKRMTEVLVLLNAALAFQLTSSRRG